MEHYITPTPITPTPAHDHAYQTLTLRDLPESFRHERISEILFRSSISTSDDIRRWIGEYSVLSKTSWVVKDARRPTGRKFIQKKLYTCHHTAHRRNEMPEGSGGRSKNLHCLAEISIKIKPNIPHVRIHDTFARDGLFGIIEFRNEHSHELNTPNILSSLRPTEEMKTVFYEYFARGLGIKESMKCHEAELSMQFGGHNLNFANAQINPKYRTVENWHDHFLRENVSPPSGPGIMKINVIEEMPEETSHEEKRADSSTIICPPNVDENYAKIESTMQACLSTLQSLNFRHYKSLLHKHNSVVFKNLLNVLSGRAKRRFRRGMIPAQPTSISKRQPGVTKRHKRLPSVN